MTMSQAMPSAGVEGTSSGNFAPFDFDSLINSGQLDVGSETVLTAHQHEPRSFTASFWPINGTNIAKSSGSGYSGKHNGGAYDPDHSPSLANDTCAVTHINPTAIWNVDQQTSSPEEMEEVDWDFWSQSFAPLFTDKAAHHNQKHGQITPPDDFSLDNVGSSAYFTTDHNTIERNPTGTNGDDDTARGSSPGRRVKAVVEGEGDRSRRRRFRKGSQPGRNTEPLDLEAKAKREKFLKRNRTAACLSRQKKKEWTNSLEMRVKELTVERTHLSANVASLKEELLNLKSECLKHADCSCKRMRDYLIHTIATMPPSSESVFGQQSRRSSMSVDSHPASVTTDEEMRSSLSVSIRQQVIPVAGRPPGMHR